MQVIPSNQRKKHVETLLKALDAGTIGIGELLQVAQYDLTTRKPRGELATATKRIANVLGFRDKRKLSRETSSTYLFSTAIYHVLRDLVDQYGLVFAIEPRIPSTGTITYDYAIIDASKKRIVLLVEVKRLQKLGNIEDHINTFREKVHAITHLTMSSSMKHVALHLHVTPDLCREYKGIERLLAGIGLLLSEAKQPILIISTNMCENGDSATRLREQLTKQVEAVVSS